ncbi:MAG: type I-B CRISPR-associated protein Cas5b [Lachnospiraceae bacterium]|nr:type I-B CRISPR-associated protein Cas5b [Lachnospiraceae bacterium]
MEALRFKLGGKTAFFKNPEVNTYFYFSFGQIHKPALLGMMGAVMGYRGYEAGYGEYPQYYELLKDLRIAVIPEAEKGYFPKKIQSFNNTVGYASQEQGGNLIVKEQWLENPLWTVYIMMDSEISRELADRILQHRCTYMPYLGKNDHPAVITEAVMISLEETEAEGERIHSLFPASAVTFDWLEDFTFKYEEYLPAALKTSTNHYEMQKFCYTDALAETVNEKVFCDGERNLIFY